MARHHDPRSGRSRNRDPEQCDLCRPPRMEPLLLRQGPAHRKARRPTQPASDVGSRCGTRASHCQRRGAGRRPSVGNNSNPMRSRRDETGNALNRAHRRKFLFSGLLKCGHCGGGYTIVAQDRYGCATRRSKGTCDNCATVSRQEIEGRVLDGLKERLLAPELVREFAQTFQEEINRVAAERNQQIKQIDSSSLPSSGRSPGSSPRSRTGTTAAH